MSLHTCYVVQRLTSVWRLKGTSGLCSLHSKHHSSRSPNTISGSFYQSSHQCQTRNISTWRQPFASEPALRLASPRSRIPNRQFSRPYKAMAEPLTQRAVPSLERLTDEMEVPALDDRKYRVIRLPNQLEALLIHDQDTDKASAALDVNVGSFSDADDMPGMAHAVEHLLFMGTEKYPEENAYNQYLTAHSGSSNAYTASTSTNYYFEVAASSTPSNSKASSQVDVSSLKTPSKTDSPLHEALDRFAQFFIKPLFLEDTLDRELRAVDSENKKNLQSDTWRLHQLNKSLSNPDHPFCHFSTGNYETLHDIPLSRGVKIRDEFIKFYEKHYSANRMKLVVLGRESLDELETWVAELFSAVKDQNLPRYRWDHVSPYMENELLMQLSAKPVFDMRVLDLFFPYPDEEDLFESKPSRYLSHLIGHEGPGSILAYLKEKGWANGLGAGGSPLCPGSALFSISVRLTEDGLKNYQEVTQVIFQYIALLKETPPQEWIFEELKKMSEVDFKFKQKSSASKTTSALSAIMQKPYPRDCLLSGPSLVRTFNPEAIANGLSHLRPDNFRLTVVSQEYPGTWTKKEKWYGTEYNYEKIPQDFQDTIQSTTITGATHRPAELHLPLPNEFIPTRLDVEKKETLQPAKAPRLIRNDEHVRTWYKKDDQFWVPKANLHITLRSPLANITPQCSVMAQLYAALVQDALVEYSYNAEISGLDYSLSSHSLGLDVAVAGYNDKMAVLLEKVLVSMRDLVIREDRFRITKERLMRGYKNWDFQQPYHQIGTYSRWLTTERGWINEQYLVELKNVTEEDIRIFFPQLLHQLHIEVLAHGNLHKEDALRFTDLVESVLKPRMLPPSQWPIRRSLVFPPGSNFVYERTLTDPANINHCIEYILYTGNNQDRGPRAKTLLISQMVDEPCFDQLRTKEQLGYVVFSGPSIANTWVGFRILVQSEKSPHYLEGRIDAFLAGIREHVTEMDDQAFEKHKSSLINTRLERLKNLNQETNRFWNHILSEGFDFEQAEADVAEIETLTKTDMLEFYEQFIAPSSPTRAKLAVHMHAQTSASTIAAKTTPGEQAAGLEVKLVEYLESQHIPVDVEKLHIRLEKVDVLSGNTDSLIAAVSSYLVDDAKVPADTATQIIESATPLMGTVLASVGVQTTPNVDEEVEVAVGKATRVEDVHAFKSSLHVSPGPQPVKDITEFEDNEPKL